MEHIRAADLSTAFLCISSLLASAVGHAQDVLDLQLSPQDCRGLLVLFAKAIADKPGALGKSFLSLAERGVNILAFQSYVEERESLVRFVADDVATAEAVLREKGMIFEQTDVAVVKLGHRPGSLGRAARRRGEAQINIDYSYCGFEPGSALALLVFGVDNLSKAATLLDELAAEDR